MFHFLETNQYVFLFLFLFLGWKDSNLRMAGPKPAALPLGHTPLIVFLPLVLHKNFLTVKNTCCPKMHDAQLHLRKGKKSFRNQ